MSDEGELLVEHRGAVLWLTINREARRNAITREVIAALHRAFADAREDPELRLAVLTGTGDKAFCAGADLSRGTGAFRDEDDPTTDFGRLARAVRELGIPLIARINGACAAGGMGLMGLCDIAVAADHACFGLPEVRVGVFPMQVLVYLRDAIGDRLVNELCLIGDSIDAGRAHRIGLVNSVVPAHALDAEVGRFADGILAASPAAIRRGRRAIAEMRHMSFEQALSYAESQIALISKSPDAAEGIAAFNERRKAAMGQA